MSDDGDVADIFTRNVSSSSEQSSSSSEEPPSPAPAPAPAVEEPTRKRGRPGDGQCCEAERGKCVDKAEAKPQEPAVAAAPQPANVSGAAAQKALSPAKCARCYSLQRPCMKRTLTLNR